MNTNRMPRSKNVVKAGFWQRQRSLAEGVVRSITGQEKVYREGIYNPTGKAGPAVVMKRNPKRDWRVLGLSDPAGAISLIKGAK